MEVIGREAKELFSPTAKCFKGMSILFAIWAVASLLICALVPTIIFIHLDQELPIIPTPTTNVIEPASSSNNSSDISNNTSYSNSTTPTSDNSNMTTNSTVVSQI